jgi:hypothetical protein
MSTSVMVDLVVAVFALEATYWLAVFFHTAERRHAALFGLFCALCCLTKGNGISVVLVPAILILLTRRFRLLRDSGLYIAAAIVVVLAVPFLAISYRLDAAIGDFGRLTLADWIHRVTFYGRSLVAQFALLPSFVVLLGFFSRANAEDSDDQSFPAVLAEAMKALALAAIAFHVLNPHRVIAARYLTLAIAPMLSLVPLGARRLAGWIQPIWRPAFQLTLVGAMALNFLLAKPALAARTTLGFRQVAKMLQATGATDQRVLIVSDEIGEGAFIAEMAVNDMNETTVIRGSKLLAADDWAGHNFQMLYRSSSDLMRDLEALHVTYLVVDSSEEIVVPFRGMVDDLLRQDADRLEHVSTVADGRPIAVYRLRYQAPGPAKKLRVPLTYSLGRILER